MVKAATKAKLKADFQKHLEEIKEQAVRLETLTFLGQSSRGRCLSE
jgi:ferritin-like metal-binding protein YciE